MFTKQREKNEWIRRKIETCQRPGHPNFYPNTCRLFFFLFFSFFCEKSLQSLIRSSRRSGKKKKENMCQQDIQYEEWEMRNWCGALISCCNLRASPRKISQPKSFRGILNMPPSGIKGNRNSPSHLACSSTFRFLAATSASARAFSAPSLAYASFCFLKQQVSQKLTGLENS